MGRLVPRAEAREQVRAAQARGERVVFTNGCFDLLHRGHVDLLARSRALGDVLVVGLNSDASARRIKGDGRPWMREEDRAAILAALAAVDLVVLFDEDTPLELVRELEPDVLVKGADYRREDVVGADLVLARGGRVELVPLTPGRSSTALRQRVEGGESGLG
jgi:D-beta-D-heptose 7-phosphate kinase/D-beta-D-heptose 1-phosphate adenosyltransferase